MALVGQPKLMFFDEPTSGLDPFNRREIWKILKVLKKKGRTIILTTHHLEEAEELADRVGIMG